MSRKSRGDFDAFDGACHSECKQRLSQKTTVVELSSIVVFISSSFYLFCLEYNQPIHRENRLT